MQVKTAAGTASSESFYAALSEIGQLLVRAVEPPELYEAIIEVLERRLGALLVMIGEADHAAGWFRRVAPVVVPAQLQDIYPDRTPLSVVQPSFWHGVPQLEPDLRHAPGRKGLCTAYAQHNVVSALAIPVMVCGEMRAGLVIRASDPAFFSEKMTELLQQAAASIGLGLEAQAQRHMLLQSVQEESRQRRALRLLSEMIKAVTRSADEEALLADSSDVALRVGGYRFAWIGLFDDDSVGVLQLRAHAGLDSIPLAGARLMLTDPRHAGDAVAIVLSSGEPCIRHWARGVPLEWPLQNSNVEVSAILALPLRVNDAIVGVFVIGASPADAFTEVEVRVFLEMAVELGLGMQMQRAQAARLLAERDLRFNLQHVRTILSNQPSGVLVLSEDGLVKFANEAFCALFDLVESPAELEGQSSESIHARVCGSYQYPERELARIKEIVALNAVLRSEEVRMVGGRTLLRDFMPIRIDGVPQGRIWLQHDITERKRHEARVERLAFYDVVTGLANRPGHAARRGCAGSVWWRRICAADSRPRQSRAVGCDQSLHPAVAARTIQGDGRAALPIGQYRLDPVSDR